MSTAHNMERRLAALEADVDWIRKRLDADTLPWWEQWAGAFLDDPYFAKAVKYGREYRESLRPKPGQKQRRARGHS